MKSVIIGFFCLPGALTAQQFQKVEGSLVLRTEQVYAGAFLFDSATGTVAHYQDSGVQVYPPHKIKFFCFYDKEFTINRKFEYLKQEGKSQVVVYEVVFRGPVSLYRLGGNFDNREKYANYRYYCRLADQWCSLKKFKARIYPLLKENLGETLVSFQQKQGLNPGNQADAIRIMQFYNQLTLWGPDHVAASSNSGAYARNKSANQE